MKLFSTRARQMILKFLGVYLEGKGEDQDVPFVSLRPFLFFRVVSPCLIVLVVIRWALKVRDKPLLNLDEDLTIQGQRKRG